MSQTYIVKFKPAGGPRYWCADRDGNAVHNHRQAAHFNSRDEASRFTVRIGAAKPDAVFQIVPVP